MYVAGDFAIYNGNLYRCLENDTTGAFDSSRWSYFGDIQEIQILVAIETARAEAAEQNLQNEINQEISNRIAGDTNLQNEIDGLTTALSHVLPPGASMDYYGTTAPIGWLIEDGSIYNIATYPALATILSNRYGGDGITTFAVPPSLGRFGVAVGVGFPLGSMGGAATAVLGVSNIPSHTHTIQPHNHPGGVAAHSHGITWALVPTAGEGIEGGLGTEGFFPAHGTTEDASPAFHVDNSAILTTDPYGGAGGGTTAPINTLPPYISRTRIIKT
jgi:microcystin-dependent protein